MRSKEKGKELFLHYLKKKNFSLFGFPTIFHDFTHFEFLSFTTG